MYLINSVVSYQPQRQFFNGMEFARIPIFIGSSNFTLLVLVVVPRSQLTRGGGCPRTVTLMAACRCRRMTTGDVRLTMTSGL